MKNIYQIRIHSRGGQGAKTAAQIAAEAVIENGNFAQAFSEYGPERAGAPMKTFLRLSEKEIKLHSDVKNPNMIVVLDFSLLVLDSSIIDDILEKGVILINTCENLCEIKKMLGTKSFFRKDAKIHIVDAKKIAIKILGKNLPNTVVIGSMAKLVPLIPLDGLIEKTKEMFEKKLSKDAIKKNIDAVKEGYKEIK